MTDSMDRTTVTQPRPFVASSTSNEWSSGIFDCFEDLPQCCFAVWCLPVFACKTAHDAGECPLLPVLDGLGFVPPITTALRVSVRQRYGIEGTVFKDCVYAVFLGPCSWCQISREIKIRTKPITDIRK